MWNKRLLIVALATALLTSDASGEPSGVGITLSEASSSVILARTGAVRYVGTIEDMWQSEWEGDFAVSRALHGPFKGKKATMRFLSHAAPLPNKRVVLVLSQTSDGRFAAREWRFLEKGWACINREIALELLLQKRYEMRARNDGDDLCLRV